MPFIIKAILYAMLHPFTGAFYIAYNYGMPVAVVGTVMRIAQITDAILVILAFTILERKLRKKAAK